MTRPTTSRSARSQPDVRRAGTPSAGTPRTRRKTFKQAVPTAMQAHLDGALRNGDCSPQRLKELYQSHTLARKFGVTLAQFKRYAGGVKNRTAASDTLTRAVSDSQDIRPSPQLTESYETETKKPKPATASEATTLGRDAFHRRMKAIGEIVDTTFGALVTHQPDLWGHGAYLMLVGSVVACLAERHADLSTSELATLSKILAEQRNLTLKQAEADRKLAERQCKATPEQSSVDAAGNGDARPRKLPAHFGDVVRQIYGTSFQDDFTVESAGNTPGLAPDVTGGLPTSAEAK